MNEEKPLDDSERTEKELDKQSQLESGAEGTSVASEQGAAVIPTDADVAEVDRENNLEQSESINNHEKSLNGSVSFENIEGSDGKENNDSDVNLGASVGDMMDSFDLGREDHQEQPISPGLKLPNSLELRRLPVDVLLKPGEVAKSSMDGSIFGDDIYGNAADTHSLFRKTCLNPIFSLRTQLMLSFGSFSATMIVFVLVGSIVIAWNSGENVKSINQSNFEELIIDLEGKFARYLAESLTPKLIPEDTVRTLYQSLRDRFAGYPNDGDEFVPFNDIYSQTNKYPIVGVSGNPLPLDWQIDVNINEENHEEHVQGRWSWFETEPAISTANAFYVMQGMCDPSVTDPSAMTYWENCTDANNDVSTGGVVKPSPTNAQIYRKSSSLSPMLKAIFESHQDIRELGAYFANSGAGAAVNFPHYQIRTNNSYTSIGCDWMNKPNPYDPSRPIGTKEEIAKCNPAGTLVSARVYNPLERGWCRDQALKPFEPIVEGPFVNAWYEGQLLMSMGQAVYDKETNNFIACTYVGWVLDNLEEVLMDARVTENSEVSIVKLDDDGTVVASTAWDSSTATDLVSIADLNIGVTSESFKHLKNLVDYETTWDPTEVRAKYGAFTTRNGGLISKGYPMPGVPDSYDPSYKPLYLAMFSANEEDVFKVVHEVKDEIDDHVQRVIFISVIVGVIGLAMVLVVVAVMSSALTAPLNYMNTAADKILNNFGSSKESLKKIKTAHTGDGYCTPRTELSEVLKEFNKMLKSFGGTFASKAQSVKSSHEEVPNQFEMQKEFVELYDSRKVDGFAYNIASNDGEVNDMTDFFNLGSNIIFNDTLSRRQSTIITGGAFKREPIVSRLFFWIALTIGIPLLLTIVAILGTVMYNVSKEFDSSIATAESFYVAVKLEALFIFAKLRAELVSGGTSKPLRDLFLVTRYANWLLFDGLERADSFTHVKSGTEECKNFSAVEDCPYYKDNYVCDCAWNEAGRLCQNYTFDTRDRQDLFFSCESLDTFPNGDRNFSSFPDVSYSPESTAWWDDITTLPGSEKGSSASGYETTYDRLRVSSAIPVHQLVYNQDIEKLYMLGSYVAFEADGMFLGYRGCTDPVFADRADWSSTRANGASDIRPELCPLGKYGYDPRCREWYHTGKTLAEADGTPLHVTAPYVFGTKDVIGQSATSPLIDPETSKHVGQVLVDFLSGPIFDTLNHHNTPLDEGGFPVLITASKDADSVVGPGFSARTESAKPISELILRHDHDCNTEKCEEHRQTFRQILLSMKGGSSGKESFSRTSSTGSTEKIYIAYYPVLLKGYRPVNSKDFSRGLEVHEHLVYSLALAETESGLLEPFEQIEEDTSKQIKSTIGILAALVIVSISIILYISNVVTLSLTEPMLFLLEAIRSINRLKIDEEPLMLDRSIGSRELISVSETVQTLYKIVRCGNFAFFSGDLDKAYAVLRDALRLFKRLENKKAIGIVSNNLGNLLLVMYRSLEEEGLEAICGMTKQDIINKGTGYYHDAIQLGEKAYDEFHEVEGWSPNCLDFMQHLSNRYFNRGVFLLTVKDGHTQPGELERLGMRDIEIARDMDMEIADAGLDAGWGQVNRIEKLLEVTLVRVKGHLMLQEMGYPDDWDTDELLQNAFDMLKKEIKNDASTLFQTITVVGRLQEIETEFIRYYMLKGESRLAAQIAIRMLFEDECTFPLAQMKAMEALAAYMETMEVDEATRRKMNRQLQNCQVDLELAVDDMDKSRMSTTIDDSEDLNIAAMRKSVAATNIKGKATRSSRSSIVECRKGYCIMEDF